MYAEFVAGRRLRQLPGAVRRAVRHPQWLVENVRLARDRHRETQRAFSLDDHADLIAEAEEAVSTVTGATPEAYRAAERDLWTPKLGTDEPQREWDARTGLLHLVGTVTRLLAPRVVVETGVARGYTSATILHALRDDPEARLYSIDLPPLEVDEAEFIGQVVPDELRPRWTLELGPSRQLLSGMVERVAPLDLFVHDADHTYPSQLEEYRTVWPHLRSGGVLVSDDVGNPAFVDFAREVGERGYLVRRTEATAFGLMRKP